MSDANTTRPNTATTNDGAWCVHSPNVDIYENDKELLLIADVPGAAADRVSVDLLDSILSISAEIPKADEYKESYRRQFKLSTPVDADKMTAELRAGELLIRLGKAESQRPKRIDVKAS